MTTVRLLLLCGLVLVLAIGLTQAAPGSAQAPEPRTPPTPAPHEPPCPSESLCGREEGTYSRWRKLPEKDEGVPEGYRPELVPMTTVPGDTGGPDAFGYTYNDSAAYSWIDATGGSQGPTGDDDSGGPYLLGFTFNFYSIGYTEFYISTNGIVTFGSGSSDLSNDPIPNGRSPNNLIAPFWDDLNPSAGGAIYYQRYGSTPNRYIVIEWHEVYRFGTTDPQTFEVILYENGNIKFQYRTMTGDYGSGGSASVGIENDAGDIGLEYSYNSARISDGLAVLFTYPPARPNVWFRPQVGGAMVPQGITAIHTLQVVNIGTSGSDTFDLTSSSSWPLNLYDASGANPLTDTDHDGIVDTGQLPQGRSVTIVAKINVPASASAGQGSSATVQATSSRSPSKYRTATLNTAVPGSFAQVYFENYATDGSTDRENYLDINRPTGLARRQVTNDNESTEYTAVDVTPDGKIIYVWDRDRAVGSVSVNEVEYTVLDAAGRAVVPLTKVTDHSSATSDIYDFSPVVATFPNGNFIIAWARQPHPSNVYYAVYNSAGSVVRSPTALTHNGGADYPTDYPPSVATTEDGRAVLAWEHAYETAGGSVIVDVQYVVLNSTGGIIRSITNLTRNSGDYDDYTPRLAPLPNSRVLVDWSGEYYNTYINEICYAVLNSAGNMVKRETVLTNSGTSAENHYPDAVSLSDGRIAVAWSRADASGVQIQYALLSSAYSVVVAPTTLPNPAARYNWNVSLVAGGEGGANLTWLDGDMNNRLYFAALNSDGTVRAPATIYRQAQNSYISSSWNGYGNDALPASGPRTLEYAGYTINDDNGGESIGNGNGTVNPGETIEMYVILHNTGTGPASGVSVSISENSPYVDGFLYNTDSAYPDIPGSGIGINGNDFDFTVDSSTPNGHVINFTLTILASDSGPWTDAFQVPVHTNAGPVGPLEYNSHTIDDNNSGDSFGNNDGIVNPGETIEMRVNLHNAGTMPAMDVDVSVSENSPYVDGFLHNPGSAYPDIPGGGIDTNNDDFDFTVDSSTPDGHVINFTLTINASNEGPWTDSFPVVVRAPDIVVTPGSLNVTLSAGQSTQRTMTIRNLGQGTLSFQMSERDTTPASVFLAPYARSEAEMAALRAPTSPQGENEGSPSVSPFAPSAFGHLQGALRILAWVRFTDYDQEYANTLNAIGQHVSNFTLTETSTEDATELNTLLQNTDVFLIPEQEGGPGYSDLYALGQAWTSALDAFLQRGGTLLAMDFGGSSYAILEGAGILDVTEGANATGATLSVVPVHPLTDGLPSTFIGSNGTEIFEPSALPAPVVASANFWPVVMATEVHGGNVAVIGFDFFQYNDPMTRLMANAVQWVGAGADVLWLFEDPISGSVPPGGNQEVVVTFDASDSASGTYTADIIITNNDPDENQIIVPVTFTRSRPGKVYLPLALNNLRSGPLVCNGSFETGSFEPCWNHGGELVQSISTTVVRSGTHSARLGDPNYNCRGGVPVGSAWLSQTITVPSSGTPTLSFWYRIFSQDRLSDTKYDSFDVTLNGTVILRAGNTTPTYGCDQPTTDTGWQLFTHDLSPYRGQTVELRFENISRPDGWYNTWTYVDDVEVTP